MAEVAGGPSTGTVRWRVADAAMILALVAGALAAELLLSRRWSALGVFSQWNVVFDTDPSSAMKELVRGYGYGGYLHPLFTYLFSIPIKLLSLAALWVGMVDDKAAFRETAALCVAPLATGVRVGLTYVVFRLLGLEGGRALAGALFGALAFSSVVFGAVPGTYAVSGCAFALLTILAILPPAETGSRWSTVTWMTAGLFAVGVTISNIVYFAIMGLVRAGRGAHPTGRQVARVALEGACVLAAAVGLNAGLGRLKHAEHSLPNVSVAIDFVRQFTPSPGRQVEQLIRFPEMLSRSLLATVPTEGVNAPAVRDASPIQFAFTYSGLPVDWMSTALWGTGIAVLGTSPWMFRRGGLGRPIGFAALAAIGTYGVVFSLFGLNTFLYSQYWQVPSTFLIGAALAPAPGAGWRRWVPVVALLMFMLAADWFVVHRITARMAEAVASAHSRP